MTLFTKIHKKMTSSNASKSTLCSNRPQKQGLTQLNSFFLVLVVLYFGMGTQTSVGFQASYTFRVTVPASQLNPGDRVGVRGSHPELGEWKETTVWLSLNAQEEWEGEVSIKRKEASEVLYKYIIESKSSGSLIWEAGANRTLSKDQKNKKHSPIDRFGRLPEQALLNHALELSVQVDLSSFYIPMQELDQVLWMSDQGNVGFILEQNQGLPLTASVENPAIWTATLPLETGDRRDFSFKLAFIHFGEVFWESIPGHANHIGLLAADQEKATLSVVYDAEKGQFIPNTSVSQGVVLDQFDALKSLYSSDYSTTEYAYMEVLHQVVQGQTELAWQSYQAWKTTNPAGREIDDMVFIYSDYLAEQTSVDVAEQFLEQQSQQEPNAYRKVQLQYHHGELLQRNGQNELGRKIHKRLLAEFNPTIDKQALKAAKTPEERRRLRKKLPKSEFEAQLNYARQALTWSYLTDSNPDSIRLGEAWLASNTQSETSHFKRQSLKQYIGYMSRKGERGKVREAFDRYTQEGTGEQQTQARLWQMEQELDWGEWKKAGILWDSLNTDAGLGLNSLSELEQLGQQQDGSEQQVQRLRAETMLNKPNKTQSKKRRLLQRMQLRRAQVLLGEDQLEPANVLETAIEPASLPQKEQWKHEQLKEELKERQAEKKRKKQEEQEKQIRNQESN